MALRTLDTILPYGNYEALLRLVKWAAADLELPAKFHVAHSPNDEFITDTLQGTVQLNIVNGIAEVWTAPGIKVWETQDVMDAVMEFLTAYVRDRLDRIAEGIITAMDIVDEDRAREITILKENHAE
jgi:hypothetical protein